MDPTIGIVTRISDDEARPAYGADMSTIGLIGPMEGFNDDIFPLDTPVKGYSNDSTFLKAMGQTGFIPDAVRGINDQLGEAQFAAQLVVIRTAKSALTLGSAALKETILNIVGDATLGTGCSAFLLAPELCACTPRLIMAPGYTSQVYEAVDSVKTTVRGQGYVPFKQYPLVFSTGGAGSIKAKGYVTAGRTGQLGNPVLTSPGSLFNAAVTATVAAPPEGGVQGTFAVTTLAFTNPVIVGVDGILNQYLAHGIVESAGTSQADDEAFRETLNSKRLIALSGGVKVLDPATGQIVDRPFAPRFAGVLVRRDRETGGPFHSACNQPIKGIVGPTRRIAFNISDGANEGQALLALNMGIIVRGDVGNDFSIASGGYTVLATDNAGEDDLWRFYNQQRGRDYIHITMTRALRFYLGKFNMTGQTINAITGTMKNILRDLQANGNIIGWKVQFTGALNSADEIRKGNVLIQFAAEEPAPLRKITTVSSRYRPAIDAMVSQLEAQLNLAA